MGSAKGPKVLSAVLNVELPILDIVQRKIRNEGVESTRAIYVNLHYYR